MIRRNAMLLLTVLLGLQLLLAGLLTAPVNAPAPPTVSLLAVDMKRVETVEIADGEGHAVRLQLTDDGWQLPGHFDFPVPAERVAELLQRLTALKPALAVAGSAEAAARFHVADDGYERRVRLMAGDAELGVLYLGDAAGPRRAYARAGGGTAIHPVELSGFELPATPTGWTDKAYLYREADGLAEVRIGTLVLLRDGDGWRLADQAGGEQTDSAKADALVLRLLRLNFMAVSGGVEALPKGEAMLTASLRYADGRQLDYRFVDPGQQGDPLLQASDLAHVLRIGSYAVNPLLDAKREDLLKKAD